MAMTMRGISGDARFFEESMNVDRIHKLLDNKLGVAGHAEKLEAMKSLLASISKGEDVSVFFADVVKNVIVASVEVKKLVYMYLVHYADANAQCRELALLSINSFQKDLADPNQLIRALALRVMTNIRVRDILQIQLIAIRKCAADSSPYVRKCAANALSKVYSVDADQKDVLAEIIGSLLNDSSTMVLGSAMQALNEVCPDRLDLLHRPFRKICHLMADIDEWGQIVTINVLTRYCRDQFQSPDILSHVENHPADGKNNPGSKRNIKEMFPIRKVKKAFYSDEEDGERNSDHGGNDNRNGHTNSHVSSSPFLLGGNGSSSAGGNGAKNDFVPHIGSVFRSNALASGIGNGEELDEDHRLLLRSSIPLLKSRNSAVVLAVSTLHYYCGTHSMATCTLIGKSLVRIMRNQREIQYVVLSVVSSMANSRPDMFLPFLQDFFVRATDPSYARKLKLEILTSLVTPENVHIILREFQAYVRHVDKSFVTMTVGALGRVADAMPSVAERCLSGLMRLVKSSNEQVVAESVVVIRQLLQQNNVEKDAVRVVRSLAAMLVSGRVTSSSARASIVWMLGEYFEDKHKNTVAMETLRLLVKDFSEEATEVRLQILNLAVKLGLYNPQEKPVQLLLTYVLELCKYDTDYDVRDRARLVRSALGGNPNVVNPHKLFTSKKPAPLIGCDEEESKKRFTLGTLSDIVRHNVSGYSPLPTWRTERPDRSLRDESSFVEEEHGHHEQRGRDRRVPSHDRSKKKSKKNAGRGFYSEDEEDSCSDAGSDSESESGSESGSEYSGSDADSEQYSSDESSSDNRSGSGSSSGSEADSDSEEEDSESVQESEDETSPSPRARRHLKSKGKHEFPEHVKKQTSPLIDPFDPMNFLGGGGGGSMNNRSTSSSTSGGTNHNPTHRIGQNSSSLLGDLMNLSIMTTSSTPAIKHELLSSIEGDGLEIQYAFLRQPSMYSPTMNLIQLWLTNKSSQPISRIKIECKNQEQGQQVVSFPEIPVLFPNGAPSMAQIHVDFAGQMKKIEMELLTSETQYEMALYPTAGELLVPHQMHVDEFIQRLSRADPSTLHTSDLIIQVPVQLNTIIQGILRECHLFQIYEMNQLSGNGQLKFAGRTRGPGNTTTSTTIMPEIVLVALDFQLQSGKSKLLVLSSSASFAQQIAESIKRQIALKK
jgi:AP-3 complex subunit beta